MIHTARFALEDEAAVRDLIRENGWATLVSCTDDGPVASHLPVLLDERAAELTVLGHLGRPDERAHQIDGTREALLIVQGPSGYISPSWYGPGPAVPTWNYLAVHLCGVLELLDHEESVRVMTDTVDQYESVRPDPVMVPPELAQRAGRGAVGIRMRVTRWQGKAKLSQNKPREVAERVAAALESDPRHANPALAAAMRADLAAHPERR